MTLLAVATTPIPDERLANKGDVANWFEISTSTLDNWIRRGCPYTQRGDRGKSWQFDLLEVVKWKYGIGNEKKVEEEPDKFPPKDRLDWYRGEREKTRDMEEKGKLINAIEMEKAVSEAFKTVAVTLESLPDVLERDAGLKGPAVQRAQEVIDLLRGELYASLTAT